MAEDDHLFAKAAPNLFCDGFAKKAKERDEELKCLTHASLQGRDHRKTLDSLCNSGLIMCNSGLIMCNSGLIMLMVACLVLVVF